HPGGAARAATARRVRLLASVRRRAGARGIEARSARHLPAVASRAVMIVNQWVPAAHKGDAIGDSARRGPDSVRGRGPQSEPYALTIDDDLRSDVRRFDDGAARRGDITIFHYALPSPMTGAFASLPSGKVVQYHNVTPAAYFAPYDPALFRLA